ncbi:MAG TPA: hypothetical protein VIC26_03270 [Marinagarivorans sp.]
MFNKTTILSHAAGLFAKPKSSRGGSPDKSAVNGQKIAPVGLPKEEVTLLTSMVSIVAIRTQGRWQMSTIDDAEVFFVDCDSKEGASFVRRYGERFPIIRYSHKPPQGDVFCLSKPLRARDLLSALKAVSAMTQRATVGASGSKSLQRTA